MSAPACDVHAGWQLGQTKVIVGFWGFLCRSWCFQSRAFQRLSNTHVWFFPQTRTAALLALLSLMQRDQTGGAGLPLRIWGSPSLLTCSPGALSSPFGFSERHQMHVLPQMALRSGCKVCLCFFLFPKAVGCHFR